MALLILAALFLSAVVLLQWARRNKSGLRYPPGPPADPIIGHLRIMPKKEEHETFHRWSQQYGDVMYLEVLGKPIVILSSEQAASDLLDKRSGIYSDRPAFPLFQRIGFHDFLGFVPYGELSRKLRKLVQTPFERTMISAYRPIQEQEANLLLMNLLRDGRDISRSIHLFATAFIMQIIYGQHVSSTSDTLFVLAEEFVRLLLECSGPSLLDISPYFEKLPSWFPGAWHVRCIQKNKPLVAELVEYPVSVVEKQMASGNARPSIVSQHLDELARVDNLTAEQRRHVSIAATQLFGGATETTWGTIMTCILCLVLNPEVQRRAQEELDRVVGQGRLPDFSDRDSLPYVGCIMHEAMRWHPVAPLGIPHRLMSDDEYRGMYIPKGATVIANAWSITQDETKFHEPHRFKPERFLPKPEGLGEEIPSGAFFGRGRRICPGRYLANDTVWIAVARILAVFTIYKAKDIDGNVIEPEIAYVTTITSNPKPFKCDIQPRSPQAAKLIAQACDMALLSSSQPPGARQ